MICFIIVSSFDFYNHLDIFVCIVFTAIKEMRSVRVLINVQFHRHGVDHDI